MQTFLASMAYGNTCACLAGASVTLLTKNHYRWKQIIACLLFKMVYTHNDPHTHSLTHTHTHTLSLSHTHTHTLSLSHTHTHSLSHTHTHTHSHTHTNAH